MAALERAGGVFKSSLGIIGHSSADLSKAFVQFPRTSRTSRCSPADAALSRFHQGGVSRPPLDLGTILKLIVHERDRCYSESCSTWHYHPLPYVIRMSAG